MYALKEPLPSPQPIGNVIRLNPFQTPVHYIDVGEKPEEIGQFIGLIPQAVVCEKLKVSSKTLVQYRQVALGYNGKTFSEDKGIGQYRESAYSRSPDFLERKADSMIAREVGDYAREVYPDEPPFTEYEAWCLIQIGKLYKRMRRRAAVETYVQNHSHLFTQEQFLKCQEQERKQ